MIITNLEVLREKSKEYTGNKEDLQELFKLLDESLKESEHKGVGLSGIQIGIYLRVAIIRTPKLSLDLYNARITAGTGSKIGQEGCLSLPNQFMNVSRATEISILNGDGKSYELKGFEARVAQHEIDHWDGILITDRRV
jgi:peptide deformylase